MSEDKQLKVVDDIVVTMDYVLSVDGEVIEDSTWEDGEELVFLEGAGQILPALEEALQGMGIGDQKEVTLQPEDGYGEYDPEEVVEFPRSEFPDDIPMEVGTPLLLTDDEDEEQQAFIEAIEGDVVKVNLNHPLAGKVLNFTIKITGLREATAEELDHGHVHFGDDHDYEDEDEEE